MSDLYFRVKPGSALHKDYFKGLEGTNVAIKVFSQMREKYGIETKNVYLLKNRFRISPTQTDYDKFKDQMVKSELGKFRQGSAINKEWVDALKDVERMGRPQLFYYFDLLGHSWKERLFHKGEEIYGSVSSDGEVSKPEFIEEMKASEFYKIIEEMDAEE